MAWLHDLIEETDASGAELVARGLTDDGHCRRRRPGAPTWWSRHVVPLVDVVGVAVVLMLPAIGLLFTLVQRDLVEES